jgi:hypothetical protein
MKWSFQKMLIHSLQGGYSISLETYFFDVQDTHTNQNNHKDVCLRERRLKMVIIATMLYPTESTKEIVKRFMEQPPLPAYITMKGPYLTGEVGAGIKSLIVYEYDQSKFSEAMEFLGARYAKYIGVPGYTYSIQTWVEVKEALRAVGMGEKPKGK